VLITPPVLIRYCDDQFDSESSTATIGVDFKVRLLSPPLSYSSQLATLSTLCTDRRPSAQVKKLSVHGTAYRLNLLDTAGQERFRTLSNSYYRGAHGVILVYDISNRPSFQAMERWFEEAETNAMPGAILYLVGNKMDKASSSRVVRYEEGEELARRHGCGFCEVSAKTRDNVRKPFVDIVDQIVRKPELLKASSRRSGTVALVEPEGTGSICAC
jgi:Ras-related protein Rab-18